MKNDSLLVLSDAVLGFGSPQIPAITRILADNFALIPKIVEPRLPESLPQHLLFPDLMIERITTLRHVYNEGGRAEYLNKAAEIIDQERPEMLVVCCTFTLPSLLKIKHRPNFIIYYAIESIIQYGIPDTAIHHVINDMVDYIIFPEENRACLDGNRCGLLNKPFSIILNSAGSLSTMEMVLPSNQRNGRIISQGTIGVKQTFSHYFLDRKIRRLPIDIYGPLVDSESQKLLYFEKQNKHKRKSKSPSAYFGNLNIATLAKIRRKYLYSLCIWSPDDERGYYAPSNKFFEAISSGVPPISAPHPQHERLIKEFECGILLEGWEFNNFRKGVLLALKISKTSKYAEMVQNCLEAVRSKLNSEHQFNILVRRVKQLYLEKRYEKYHNC